MNRGCPSSSSTVEKSKATVVVVLSPMAGSLMGISVDTGSESDSVRMVVVLPAPTGPAITSFTALLLMSCMRCPSGGFLEQPEAGGQLLEQACCRQPVVRGGFRMWRRHFLLVRNDQPCGLESPQDARCLYRLYAGQPGHLLQVSMSLGQQARNPKRLNQIRCGAEIRPALHS